MNRNILFVSIWFQALWFVAVVGRESLLFLLALSILLTAIWSIKKGVSDHRMVWIALIGIALDVVNTQVGIFLFEAPVLFGIPLWLTGLWVLFGWYAVMMQPVIKRVNPIILIGFCAVGGALSYLAGHRFGAVELPHGALVMATTLALEWIVMALIVLRLIQTPQALPTASRNSHQAKNLSR